MVNLSDEKTIKTILSKNGFSFSKSLGQNFIIHPDVCPKMAESAVPGSGYGVLEIGPGIGVLTVELCKRAERVVAVELDERLPAILSDTLSDFDNVKIVAGDAMKLDLGKLIADEFPGLKVVVCANLPYYITSPMIMKLLEDSLPVESVVVMVQKEAAERLCADVGTREAGAVTVAVSYFAETEELFFVDRNSFLPAPKVDSEVIRLTPKAERALAPPDEKAFFRMVTAAFTKRRKTISNSLLIPPVTKDSLLNALDSLGISPSSRIEQLTLSELLDIYDCVFKDA